MSARTLAVGCAVAALGLSACGSTSKPLAGADGTRTLAGGLGPGRGVIDDPRTRSLPCLRATKLAVLKTGVAGLIVGTGSDQARVSFLPTPGAAQHTQIVGASQSAEVIGSALLFPQAMSDQHLKQVETCLAKGVTG
jgi:hypothetical protein